MKGAIITVLIILAGGILFYAGRATSDKAVTAQVSSMPTVPVVVVQAPGPTQYDRDLMSALNAVQSGVKTGLSQYNYSELITTARTRLADLKLNSGSSPLIRPAEAYLEGHGSILTIWRKNGEANESVYVNKETDSAPYEFAVTAAPDGSIVEANLPNHTYEVRGGINQLWHYTEVTLWSRITTGWKQLNGGL